MVAVLVELGLVRFLFEYFVGVVFVVEKIQSHLIKHQVRGQEADESDMGEALAHGLGKYKERAVDG
jgi:hypothetical protein